MNQYARASNEQLLQWYKESDAKAFEEFYRRHADLVFNYICSRCRSQTEANDIFQETFLKAHKYTKSFDQSKSALGWMFQIARHALIDHIKHRRSMEMVSSTMQDDGPSGFSALEAGEYLETLLDALAPEDKKLIECRFIKDMSFEDISLCFGWSEDNTRQKISRLLRRVRKQYSEL